VVQNKDDEASSAGARVTLIILAEPDLAPDHPLHLWQRDLLENIADENMGLRRRQILAHHSAIDSKPKHAPGVANGLELDRYRLRDPHPRSLAKPLDWATDGGIVRRGQGRIWPRAALSMVRRIKIDEDEITGMPP